MPDPPAVQLTTTTAADAGFARMRSRLLRLTLLSMLIATTSAALEPPRIYAVRVDQGPVIDGVLDDDVWRRAEIIDEFTQVEPQQGAEPSMRTEIRILVDGRTLYFGISCYDPEPDRIVARRMERDDFFFLEDSVSITIDTFHDHRNGFLFQTGPRGGRRDASFEGRIFEENWDGIWTAKARINAEGWFAEIAIPFDSIPFKPGGGTWGLNLSRTIKRRGETVRWADPNVAHILTDMAEAGLLEGMARAQEGLGLGIDIVPASTLRRVDDPIEDRHYTRYTPSLDAFYRIRPSLTGSLTVNNDFGEAGVDDRQLNFDRFALFFPEKREFFLQDSGIFNFGDLRRENGLPFFTRRIGLSEDGTAVSLPVGGKVAGRVGRFNVGVLDIQQKGTGPIDDTNLFVGRLSMNVLEESTMGAIVTNGDPLSNDDNTLVGVDLNFQTSTYAGNRIVTANLWGQHSFSSGVDSNQASYGIALGYPNDKINWKLKYREIQENFRPALGFVNRTGIRQYDGAWRYRWRPPGEINTIDMRVSGRVVTDQANEVESAVFGFRPLVLATEIGDGVELRWVHVHDVVEQTFPIGDVFIPVGTYDYDEGTILVKTSHNRPVRVRFEIGGGSFRDGTTVRTAPTLEWRPSQHWLLSLSYRFNQFRIPGQRALPGGGLGPIEDQDFRTHLAQLKLNIAFTPDISWNTTVQYDNVSHTMGLNSRFHWIITPGRDFFIVINQNFVTEDGFETGRTEPVIKLNWTFRF